MSPANLEARTIRLHPDTWTDVETAARVDGTRAVPWIRDAIETALRAHALRTQGVDSVTVTWRRVGALVQWTAAVLGVEGIVTDPQDIAGAVRAHAGIPDLPVHVPDRPSS